MNYGHLAHVLRDVFTRTEYTVCYGKLRELVKELRTPIHSIGSFLLHSEPFPFYEEEEYSHYWEIGVNDTFFGKNFCDLFISINYNPRLSSTDTHFIANQFKEFLKPNGIMFLVNPGYWSIDLESSLCKKNDLIYEIYRYSMFKNQKVLVYENI